MYTYFKINLLIIYALALLSVFVTLPWGSGPYLQKFSTLVLAIHILETLAVYKHLKSYKGPLLHSVGLSLLYGLLHWLPLVKRNSTPNSPTVR